MNNFELVTQIVSKTLGISIENIKVESKFVEDLGGDSLDTVELILELEDRLGIDIPEEVAENLDSVKKVVDYLDSL
jgi:acyl carrier protein